MRKRKTVPALLGLCALLLLYLYAVQTQGTPYYALEDLPPYDGSPAVTLCGGEPNFPDADKTTRSFERYSQLDYFGRCGVAYANVGPETMPTGERESIWEVKPTGWQTDKYDFVDGQNLYNRCHLIGWQLTAENANELNLITGTRYFNVQGMLPYENQVADYVRETGNHVLYRVTPVYDGSDLVARGVEMEALSVEDGGEGIRFHVYAYNVQPGVVIDYATGENDLAEDDSGELATLYILNTGSKRFHLPTCSGAKDIKPENRREYVGSASSLQAGGYTPCGSCIPHS